MLYHTAYSGKQKMYRIATASNLTDFQNKFPRETGTRIQQHDINKNWEKRRNSKYELKSIKFLGDPEEYKLFVPFWQ